MRLEQLISKALKKTNNDRYILSVAVSQRAKELASGVRPIPRDPAIKKMKYSDVALYEIANGLLEIEDIVKEQ